MAYSTSAPPLAALALGATKTLWFYTSADASATIDASGYITNGYALGMRDGDLLFAYDTGNKIWSSHTVINASGTTINLSNGTAIGSGTDSD